MARAHKLAAARRAIRLQEQRYSLFVWAGTAVAEGLVESSAEERVDRYDLLAQENLRSVRIRTISEYRKLLAGVEPADRRRVISEYRQQDQSVTPSGLARFLNPDPRQVDILARMRAMREGEEREGGNRIGGIHYDQEGKAILEWRNGVVIRDDRDEAYARWRGENRELIESVGGTI